MRDEAYKAIIEAIANEEISFKAIAVKLAQMEPEMFLSLNHAVRNGPYVPSEVGIYLDEGKKMNAIKVWRSHFSCGLKEAKEAVDSLVRDSVTGVWAATWTKNEMADSMSHDF